MTYATLLWTFGLCLLAFAVWRDVLPLLDRLVAIRERVSAPTITTVAGGYDPAMFRVGETVRFPAESLGSIGIDLDEPPPQPPIARALDDVCGSGEHSDNRLRAYLNRYTIPRLKADKLTDDEIADRLREGAQ